MKEFTLEKFEEASELVQKVTSETKLVFSEFFSEQSGNKVYFKPENMQYTGAYKLRGAYYKISTLSDEEKAKGIVTASAGNHAQGVAYAAKLAGVCKGERCYIRTSFQRPYSGYRTGQYRNGDNQRTPYSRYNTCTDRRRRTLCRCCDTCKDAESEYSCNRSGA